MLYYGKIMFYGAEGMRMRVSELFHAKGPNYNSTLKYKGSFLISCIHCVREEIIII